MYVRLIGMTDATAGHASHRAAQLAERLTIPSMRAQSAGLQTDSGPIRWTA
jgi:hypothetical protein